MLSLFPDVGKFQEIPKACHFSRCLSLYNLSPFEGNCTICSFNDSLLSNSNWLSVRRNKYGQYVVICGDIIQYQVIAKINLETLMPGDRKLWRALFLLHPEADLSISLIYQNLDVTQYTKVVKLDQNIIYIYIYIRNYQNVQKMEQSCARKCNGMQQQ